MGSPLSSVPTGAGLGALLEPIDAATVPDVELLELLTAETRQLAYQQARQWAVMNELARRAPGNFPGAVLWRPDEIFEAAVDEVRAELVLSRQGARAELGYADQVFAQPRVAAALRSGAIDRQRAIVITEGCFGLTDEQAAQLVDEVLPTAHEVNANGLRDRVRRVAIALDPAWAERRYRDQIQHRRVIAYLRDDGTAVISAQGLPADQAMAACARVVALAARAKRAGAAASVDHLRTEVFAGLLDGRFHGMSQSEMVAALVAQFPKPVETDPAPAATAPEPAEPAETAAHGEPAQPEPAQPEPVQPEPVQPGVELRVGLATLLGLDERPAEIAGWGAVGAPVARTIAEKQRRAQWRFAVVDEDGRLLFDGITRHRPPSTDALSPAVDGGFVELQVPAVMLDDPFFATEHPGWGPLIRDLAAQYAEQAPIGQDPAARFAGRPLRRHSQVKHRTCLFPGCRRPAAECDLDHRRERSQGGPTTDANLGPGCRHDHQLKTTGGWRLIKRDDETYVWISPLGRRHVINVDPVAPPLPDPLPRELPPDLPWPADERPVDAALLERPERNSAPPTKQPDRATDPEPPPF